jgi:hypothetical protein
MTTSIEAGVEGLASEGQRRRHAYRVIRPRRQRTAAARAGGQDNRKGHQRQPHAPDESVAPTWGAPLAARSVFIRIHSNRKAKS